MTTKEVVTKFRESRWVEPVVIEAALTKLNYLANIIEWANKTEPLLKHKHPSVTEKETLDKMFKYLKTMEEI